MGNDGRAVEMGARTNAGEIQAEFEIFDGLVVVGTSIMDLAMVVMA